MGAYDSKRNSKRDNEASTSAGGGADHGATSQKAQAAELRALASGSPVQLKAAGDEGGAAADEPDWRSLYEQLGDHSAAELSMLATMVDQELGSEDPGACLRFNVAGLDVGAVPPAQLAAELEQAAAHRGVTSELAEAIGAPGSSGKELYKALITQEDLRAVAKQLDDKLFPGGSVGERLAPALTGGGAFAANDLIMAAMRRGMLKQVKKVADELGL